MNNIFIKSSCLSSKSNARELYDKIDINKGTPSKKSFESQFSDSGFCQTIINGSSSFPNTNITTQSDITNANNHKNYTLDSGCYSQSTSTDSDSSLNLAHKIKNTSTSLQCSYHSQVNSSKKDFKSLNSDISTILSSSFKLSKKMHASKIEDNTISFSQPEVMANDWSVSLIQENKFQKSMLRSQSFDSLANVKSISTNKILNYNSSKKIKPNQIEWNNPVLGPNNQASLPSTAQTKLLSKKSFNKVYSSFSFTKDMLKKVQVLGQVDNKFIACIFECNNNFVLIDQHAAHERIRLEKLLHQIGYYSANTNNIRNSATKLIPPLQLYLFENDFNSLKHYKREFEEIGLKYTSNEFKNKSTFRIYISSVPSVFVNACEIQPDAKGTQINSNLIKEFILEQVNIMQSSNGQIKMSSVTIFKVLASYACHGAIKFGDPLDRETCVNMIKQLSHCNLPFQCAHGRPSIAPLLKLNMLNDIMKQKVRKPNLKRLKLKM